jgi:hypothetical protein
MNDSTRRLSGRPRCTSLIPILVACLVCACGGSRVAGNAPARPSVERLPPDLSEEEAASLGSLQQVDGYPLYTMRYYGDYAQGLSSRDGDRSAKADRWIPPSQHWACSLFAALGDENSRLYGRNFDWQYSPALLLFTDPADGYASVSMVDIAYLAPADKVRRLVDLPLQDRLGLLAAPLWPFDGMNEHGLVVGLAAVPPGGMKPDPGKPTIGSLAVIRQVLDRARDVDEAVAILQGYNIDMEGGPPLHYLVADRSGRSMLVEFYRGEVVLIPSEMPWHLATNFLRSSVGESAEGECWRYDRISRSLAQTGGRLSVDGAMELLRQTSQESTQWSVVYGMSSGRIEVTMAGQYDQPHTFDLPLIGGSDLPAGFLSLPAECWLSSRLH